MLRCQLDEGKTANLYTDSMYPFGITHDYRSIWHRRDFVGVSGKPIENPELVAKLFNALKLPEQVAIMKVQDHTKETTPESKSNRKAKVATKAAAPLPLQTVSMQAVQTPGTSSPS